MKRFKILTAIIITSGVALPGFCDFFDAGGSSNTHDMQMIRKQQFRHWEINENKDIKEQKEKRQRKEKETELNLKQAEYQKQMGNKKEQAIRPVKFTEENGQIKIEKE